MTKSLHVYVPFIMYMSNFFAHRVVAHKNVDFGYRIREDNEHTELPLSFGAPQRRLTGPPLTCASFRVSLFQVWQGH